MIYINLIIILFSTFKLSAADNTIDQLMRQRKALLDQFSSMSEIEKKNNEKQVARDTNILFLKAQAYRLRMEINEIKSTESLDEYRGWEKTAAKQLKAEKEKSLKVVSELLMSPPKKAIRCLTDAKDSSISLEAKEYLKESSKTYSKGSLFGGYLPTVGNFFRNRSKLKKELDLIAENAISSDILNNREPKMLPSTKTWEANFTPEEKKTLKDFGVGFAPVPPASIDYSHRFSTPKKQEEDTKTCSGFAISSDMESVLNKGIIKGKTVSADYTYAAILADEEQRNYPADIEAKVSKAGLCNLIGIRANPIAGVASIADGLASLSNTPTCSTNESNTSRFSKTQYRIKSFNSHQFIKTPSLNFMKVLLSAGITPMITTASEARTEHENWIYPSKNGEFMHVINVVGYGRSREANCLEEVDYFIVRDSLGKKLIHYKVPATSLLNMSVEMNKITEVQEDLLARLNPYNK